MKIFILKLGSIPFFSVRLLIKTQDVAFCLFFVVVFVAFYHNLANKIIFAIKNHISAQVRSEGGFNCHRRRMVVYYSEQSGPKPLVSEFECSIIASTLVHFSLASPHQPINKNTFLLAHSESWIRKTSRAYITIWHKGLGL